MRSALGGLLLVFALCSCGSLLPEPQDEQIFALRLDHLDYPQCLKAADRSLAIADVRATGPIAGTRIVFSDDQLTRNYYKFARWSEPFPLRLQTELIGFFERSGYFSSVQRLSESGMHGVALHLEILDGYHEATIAPGSVFLKLRARLSGILAGSHGATRVFDVTVPVEEYNSRGAVKGFSAATAELFKELAGWVCEMVYENQSGGEKI